MFEAFLTQSCRSNRGPQLRGFALALAVHVGVLGALALRPTRAPAPASPASATPITLHLRGPALPWAALRRVPAPAPPVVAAAGPSANLAHPPGPTPDSRRARRSRPVPAPAAQVPHLAILAPQLPAAAPPAEIAAPAGPAAPIGGGAPLLAGAPSAVATTATTGAAPAPLPPAPRPPQFLPEPLAHLQRLAGEEPQFPASLATGGAHYLIHARICVGPGGQVDRIDLLRTAHPTLDANVVAAVGRWRYRPLLAGGVAVPFCTLARFEFRAT